MRAVCKLRLEQFGTAGNASKIKVLPMSAMAKRYATGGLDPRARLQRSAGGVAARQPPKASNGEWSHDI